MEGARLKAENYRWFRTRTDEMIRRSAAVVSRHGRVVGEEFYGRATNPIRTPPDKKRKLLRLLVKDGEANLVKQITEFIVWCDDDWAVTALLNSVKDVADPSHMERWENARGRAERKGRHDHVLDVLDSPDFHKPYAAETQPTPRARVKKPKATNGDSTSPQRERAVSVTTVILLAAAGAVLLVGIVYLARRRIQSRRKVHG